MNRDRLDRQIAGLARISDDTATRAADPAVRDRLLDGILRDSAARQPVTRKTRRRLAVVSAASVTVLGGSAAIGWALTNSTATNTVAVECEINGSDTIIPATSGDPVTDCAAQWQRETGTTPPALTAYDNGHGGITVAPASQPPAPSAAPLPPGVTQNVTAITLQESLDDYVAGLHASCHTSASAVAFVRNELTAAGLTGWTVSPPPQAADGTSLCADTSIVDATHHTVQLRALTGPDDPNLPLMHLATRLRAMTGCDTTSQLAGKVRTAAEQLGLSAADHQYQLTTVNDDTRCAVVHETVGGTIFLTVRGPQPQR